MYAKVGNFFLIIMQNLNFSFHPQYFFLRDDFVWDDG